MVPLPLDLKKDFVTLHVVHSKPQNCLNCLKNEQDMFFGSKGDNV
jgi:hypothetical protein